MRRTSILPARPVCKGKKFVWGAPGKPLLMKRPPQRRLWGPRSHENIIATAEHHDSHKIRMYAYLGKHVPMPQKALWSPDTPVPMDQYSFKLTTLDIDAFKFWFGVKNARVDDNLQKLLHKAGLLPPGIREFNPLSPRPIFKKEELYRYWLANRPPLEATERDQYHHYKSSTEKIRPDTISDVPAAPWL